MSEVPNIFDYATKELSQDAMLCWLMECARTEVEVYQKAGKKFLWFLLGEKKEIEEEKIELYGLKKQLSKIDIFSIMVVGDYAYPIIVEDKVDTFLRNNQVSDYCKTIENDYVKNADKLDEIRNQKGNPNINWGKIQYILLKSGYVDASDNKIWEDQIKEIEEKKVDYRFLVIESLSEEMDKKKNLYKFLEQQEEFKALQEKESIFRAWMEYLRKKVKCRENDYKIIREEGDFSKIKEDILIHEYIWGKLNFASLYKKDRGNGGKLYTYVDLFTTGEQEEEKDVKYALRIDKVDEKNYNISFEQYRNEKKAKDDKEGKDRKEKLRDRIKKKVEKELENHPTEEIVKVNSHGIDKCTFFRIHTSNKRILDIVKIYCSYLETIFKEEKLPYKKLFGSIGKLEDVKK